MKKYIIKAAASVLMLLSQASCSDWLKVEMEDQIMEPVLFSNYSGYVSALNGVYLSMNDYYAQGELINILDVMAQNYYVSDENNHKYNLYQSYTFSDTEVESVNGALWDKGYNLIAHVNTVLDHLNGIENTPLTESQYAVLRGESLGLRAMLHFDILRRHGAIYIANPDAETIPYQDDTSREIKPLLPNRDLMARIISDLTEAASLLKGYDPIITEGVKDVVTEDNGVSNYDMSFRQYRLNYYAIQALLARAYMWTGDKAKAYNIATEEIINKITTDKLNVFPWVTSAQVNADRRPDLLFSPEVIFALYNSQRTKYNTSFFTSSLSMSNRLTFYGENKGDGSKVDAMYDYPNDYRLNQWAVADPLQGSDTENPTTSLYLTKFDDFESGATDASYRYMIPMIRLSEIYLIAAESTSDKEEAYGFINEVRTHRNCPDLDAEGGDLDHDLLFEFARETVGEGQLYFYYKRRQDTRIISKEGTYDFNMLLSNYVWPIPESEISKRTHIEK